MGILIYLVLLLAFPTGIILSKFCQDELKSWKNKFKIILIISLILSIISIISKFEYKIPITLSLFFIVITMFVLILKSDKYN
ncbi:MAG: hypothetical protein AABW83_01450 [Nanoarchaeota archaeon]